MSGAGASAPSDHETVSLSATVASVDPRATVTMKSKAFSCASVRSPVIRRMAISQI